MTLVTDSLPVTLMLEAEEGAIDGGDGECVLAGCGARTSVGEIIQLGGGGPVFRQTAVQRCWGLPRILVWVI